MNELPVFAPADDVFHDAFAVHLLADDGRMHALQFDGGALVDWSDQATVDERPTLGVAIPEVLATQETWPALPFSDDVMLVPALPVDVFSHAFEPFGSEEIAAVDGLATWWLLRDTPFGDAGWAFEVVDHAVRRRVAAPRVPEPGEWDATVDIDFVDFVDFLLGELELRDLIARGNLTGCVGALSALTWLAGRDEAIAQARRDVDNVRLVRDWASIIRSDEVRAWVDAAFSAR